MAGPSLGAYGNGYAASTGSGRKWLLPLHERICQWLLVPPEAIAEDMKDTHTHTSEAHRCA